MLGILPIGVIVWPGTGIQDNLADKAKNLGIPVYRFEMGARKRHPYSWPGIDFHANLRL